MISTLKNLILAFLGVLICIYIVLFRLIRERLPRDLPIITTTFEFYFYLYIVILFFILFIISVNSILKKSNTPSKLTKYFSLNEIYTLFKNVIQKISLFYWSCLETLNGLIIGIIPPKYLGLILTKFCTKFNWFWRIDLVKIKYFRFMIILGYLIPRLLFLCIFLLDIFYFKQFLYIYWFAWLHLIPIFFRFLLYQLNSFSKYNILNYPNKIFNLSDINDKSLNEGQIFILYAQDMASTLYRDKKEPSDIFFMGILTNETLKDYKLTKREDIQKFTMDRLFEYDTFIKVYSSTELLKLIITNYQVKFNVCYYGVYFLAWTFIFING